VKEEKINTEERKKNTHTYIKQDIWGIIDCTKIGGFLITM